MCMFDEDGYLVEGGECDFCGKCDIWADHEEEDE